jgi:hypothetical protein
MVRDEPTGGVVAIAFYLTQGKSITLLAYLIPKHFSNRPWKAGKHGRHLDSIMIIFNRLKICDG